MRHNHKVKFKTPTRDSYKSLNIFIEHNNLLLEYLEQGYMKIYVFSPSEPTKKIIRKRIKGQNQDWVNVSNKMIQIPHTYHDKPKQIWEKLKLSNQRPSLKTGS